MKNKALEKLDSPNGTGIFESIEYRYSYYPGSKNSPSYFKVEIDASSDGSFKIARERGFDRLFKKLGISTEIQTGDTNFDDSFYITADNEEFAKAIFSSAEKRQAVRNIFDIGFNRIEHDGKVLVALCSPFKIDVGIDEPLLIRLVSHLEKLSKYMPQVTNVNEWDTSMWKTNRVIAFSIATMVSLIGIAALVIGLTKYSPFDKFAVFLDSLKWSIPCLIGYIVFSVVLLKGRSSSHRELLVAVSMALIGFIFGVWGSEMTLNGYLDTSEATIHQAKVLSKSQSRSKNGTTYSAHVYSWRDSGSEKIQISHDEYLAIVENQTVLTITTKPGKFGFEWLEEYRLDSRNQGLSQAVVGTD